jgi:hypothetical protein
MQFSIDSIWHISWLLMILSIMALNHVIAHHRSERKIALETQRLRAALAAELRVLHQLYHTNLDLLEKNANYVLSTRSPLLICKNNLGRLTALFETSVIEQLVTLFAHNEMLEAHVAAHTMPKAGVSFRLTPHSRPKQLSQMYTVAVRHLKETREALDQLESPVPSPRWRFWAFRTGGPRKQEESEPGAVTARP